jgi:hypothetical protein
VARSDGGRGTTAVAERHRGGVTCWNPAAGVVLSHPLEPPRRRACPRLSLPIQVRKPSAEFRDSKPFKRERASHTLMTTEDHT